MALSASREACRARATLLGLGGQGTRVLRVLRSGGLFVCVGSDPHAYEGRWYVYGVFLPRQVLARIQNAAREGGESFRLVVDLMLYATTARGPVDDRG